jgi:hypothetical protein
VVHRPGSRCTGSRGPVNTETWLTVDRVRGLLLPLSPPPFSHCRQGPQGRLPFPIPSSAPRDGAQAADGEPAAARSCGEGWPRVGATAPQGHLGTVAVSLRRFGAPASGAHRTTWSRGTAARVAWLWVASGALARCLSPNRRLGSSSLVSQVITGALTGLAATAMGFGHGGRGGVTRALLGSRINFFPPIGFTGRPDGPSVMTQLDGGVRFR